MSPRPLPRELLLWLPVGIIPILNGAIRIALYARWLGEPRASLVSSALDVLAICAYASVVQRRWPAATWGGAAVRGGTWVALTTLDHFALGALVFGVPVPALFAKYDLRAGELWGVVSLAVFVAPLFGRWIAGGVPRQRVDMHELRLNEIATADYRAACKILQLEPVSRFFLFFQNDGSSEVLATFVRSDGTTVDINRATDESGYRPGLLFVSVVGMDQVVPDLPPAFRPALWNAGTDERGPVWPRWRADLWHELVHQVQDVKLGKRNPQDGHGGHAEGWQEALVVVGRAFELDQAQFEQFVDVVWGPAERYPVVGRDWKHPVITHR
jgi:hypothetical protein